MEGVKFPRQAEIFPHSGFLRLLEIIVRRALPELGMRSGLRGIIFPLTILVSIVVYMISPH
jgi:hypothetical protein